MALVKGVFMPNFSSQALKLWEEIVLPVAHTRYWTIPIEISKILPSLCLGGIIIFVLLTLLYNLIFLIKKH